MSRYLYIAVCLIFFAACDKDSIKSNRSVEGRWKMVSIVDNLTNTVQSKPVSVIGEVELQLTFTSTFAGNTANTKTPSNTVFDGDFAVTDDRGISIGPFGMTKVGETFWGAAFLKNIYNVHTYFIETPGKLNLKTEHETLVFVKM